MLFSYPKARRVDESLSVMFPGRDGRSADAEHQRQQRRHTHVVYGPPCDRYARFAMPAMLGPRQLITGDYKLVLIVAILGVLGMARLHLWHYFIF